MRNIFKIFCISLVAVVIFMANGSEAFAKNVFLRQYGNTKVYVVEESIKFDLKTEHVVAVVTFTDLYDKPLASECYGYAWGNYDGKNCLEIIAPNSKGEKMVGHIDKVDDKVAGGVELVVFKWIASKYGIGGNINSSNPYYWIDRIAFSKETGRLLRN